MNNKLGIRDIYNVEKYDASILDKVVAVTQNIMNGKISDSEFTREESFCMVMLCYAHDIYAEGKRFNEELSFDASDDENDAFGSALMGAIISAQKDETMTREECEDALFKKVASYVYIRAYNRFRAEGTLMSVYIDSNSRILNVLDRETGTVCSIDAFNLANEVLGAALYPEDQDPVDDGPVMLDSLPGEDEDFSLLIGVMNIDQLLTVVLKEHAPEVQGCREIRYSEFAS